MKNGSKKPHMIKIIHFESIFPHELINNEWKDKFPVGITAKGRTSTYNPDYFCPSLSAYIEVTTSEGNIDAQGERWRRAIENGVPLKIYWWEGQDITDQFKPKHLRGGRPRKGKQ